MNIAFRNFEPGDEVAFRELNEAWIVKHFAIEEPDLEILGNPVAKIIRPGGQIVMAVMGGAAIGCCALIPTGPGAFELGKMTVREDCRGMGAGKRLLQATIDRALKMGATRLYLESNAKLPDAIHLYESVGFRHLPPERVKPSPYARSGVYMELVFAS